MIEEASAEEEELLGANNESNNNDEKTDGETIERDHNLIKVCRYHLFESIILYKYVIQKFKFQ